MAPLLLLPLLLLLSSVSLQAQQNITLGSSLTPEGPSSYWLSPSGDFAFGFRPIEGNTSSYLLAVWFNKINDKTVAWYARTSSPEPSPVPVSSGSRLQLTSGGTLSLLNHTNSEVWTPQFVGAAAYARMLDSGNFVLAAADGSTKWGTFNNPADTILLTQELNAPNTLYSRIITTDYSNGRFLLNLKNTGVTLNSVAVPSGNQYDSYWSVLGNTTKMVFDPMGRVYIAMDNGTQINMTSGVVGSMVDYYHRATLDPDGVFRQYAYPKKVSDLRSQAWSMVGLQPPNICEALVAKLGSGICGFNSYRTFDGTNNQTTCMCPEKYSCFDEERKYKGCKPDFQPQSCDLDETAAVMQFQLKTVYNVNWPLADYELYNPITEDQCRRLCLTDCFCAVAVYNDHDHACYKKRLPLSNGNMAGDVHATVLIKSTSNLGLPLKAFTYAELEKATNGFQEILGTGASGIVYKSQLLDDLGTYIAVKKIDKLEQESEKEFTVEVQAIGRTHHKNLVRLLGLCNEGKERLLVYEFMSNGSLSIFRFGDVKLQWNLRVQLAAGVARGLLYLHEECSTQIIHCDIKPQNILLDDNFTANISDFGLAKLLRTNQTQTNTGIRGTRGYVAPEWFKSIGIAAKVDVYSFGVILLELICCRRNVELEAEEEHQKILTYWANDCYRCGSVDFLVKGDDEANCNLKVVERFVAVALWCLQEDPAMRPTMLKVTQMLDGVAAIPTPVDPSSFVSSLR
ncbi:G-type lectin S-receptor-like serine/threonine-protein kinase RLK1 [Panicum miliaceum]|uniref:Receptor-like serine/threonine-protein kinase n=1 Tax=Panicum miliaceum TaxID=4540 RepID=A0A3L6PVX9_PANMI|nr:G-type lectin S-receptor-like serine/threonine-protein kinase RLK1 [Panicum miliaceum]